MWAPLAPRRVMAFSLVNSSFLCTSRQLITQWDLYRCRHVAQAQQTGVYLCQHQARGLVSRRLMIPGVVQATAWVWNTPHLPGWSADLFLPGCLLFVSTGGLSLFCSRCVRVRVRVHGGSIKQMQFNRTQKNYDNIFVFTGPSVQESPCTSVRVYNGIRVNWR